MKPAHAGAAGSRWGARWGRHGRRHHHHHLGAPRSPSGRLLADQARDLVRSRPSRVGIEPSQPRPRSSGRGRARARVAGL
eukprot:3510208-Ditylum_brightwellii.AAC.1